MVLADMQTKIETRQVRSVIALITKSCCLTDIQAKIQTGAKSYCLTDIQAKVETRQVRIVIVLTGIRLRQRQDR